MGMSFWVAGIATACLLSGAAAAQEYTISARPGTINYLEGSATVNGADLGSKAVGRRYLNVSDTLATTEGKVEVLLTPGIFLRLGENSEIRMISPRLTDTEVAITKGEAVLEAAELLKENNVRVTDGEAAVNILRTGIYAFHAGAAASVEVLEGKASVEWNGNRVELSKGRELALNGGAKPEHFSEKEDADELVAWSKVRDEYVSASSYAAARNVSSGFLSGGYADSFAGYFSPGWFWNTGWNSWAWLPMDGAFFSPFGFGYYSPYYVSYAPVIYAPIYGGRPVPIPVNPTKPIPVSGTVGKPVVPAGGRAGAWAFAGVHSNGGHVSGAAISGRSGGGGYSHASSGSYSGGGTSSSAAPASLSSSPSGHSAGGGGGHH